ncbi:MAG: lipopolysaccharide biosynthesis protein [Geminicoccaceae bacterium]
MSTIGNSMARGAAWMVLMRLVIRGAGLINMVILARLLVPEDFGLIAMAMIFVGAIEILSEFNFDVVLIKEQQVRRAHYDTAWTLSIIRGVVMAALLLAIAGPAASVFDEPRLSPMISALSVSSLLLGLQNIGVVDFRKSLDFRKDFIFMASERVVAVMVSVGLALWLQNYWALVGGIIAGKLWRVVASYAMHPFRPTFALTMWRELFAFAKWLLLQNMLLFFRNRIDRLVIGKVLGAATLGLYTIAFDLANLVTSELMAPVRRALFPGYAKLAHQPDRISRLFVDIFGLTLWLGAPIAVGTALLADPLIHVLLGAEWRGAVPIVQMLAVAGFIALLSSGSHPVFLALGRPELQTYLAALSVVLLIPGLIVGTARAGVIGAAIAVVVAQLVVAVLDIVLVLRLLKLRSAAVGKAAWRALAALALMTAGVHALKQLWPDHQSVLADAALLGGAGLVGGSLYVGTTWLLWHLFADGQGPERHLVKPIRYRIDNLLSKVRAGA